MTDPKAQLAAIGLPTELVDALTAAMAARGLQDATTICESLRATMAAEELGPRDLAALHVADLVLAKAALVDASAQAEVGQRLQTAARDALARLRIPASTAQDLTQDIQMRLLLGESPKIGSYSGRAALTTWLRTVATREGLSHLRKKGELPGDEHLLNNLQADSDMDAQYVMQRYGGEFRAAFAEAMAGLDSADRLILRQYYVDGLKVEDIGAMAGVHKSTISRRLEAARGRLNVALRAAFAARVPASESQMLSLVRGLQDQLELSLSRLTR